MAAMGAIANGPNRIAPSPVPVGWEQLPVIDGSFSADRINVKAAETPRSILSSGFAVTDRAMERSPKPTHTADTAPHDAACATGR
jgi:hypothetical protein